MMKMVLEKSREQAEHDEQMRKKNEELLNLMQKIENEKPDDGWGFKKKLTDIDDKKQD